MMDLGPELHPRPGAVAAPDLAVAVRQRMAEQGFCRLQPAALFELCGLRGSDAVRGCQALAGLWEQLPADPYLRDGGHYRRRRHGSFVQNLAPGAAPALEVVPHRAHYQPLTYNALHGGLVRWLEPLDPALCAAACWEPLVCGLGRVFAALRPAPQWFIEAHQFRIDTAGGIGRPTPEGAHRDGVDFVAVVLIGRSALRGGESRVFEQDGERGVRFTLEQPWSVLLMDDTRVVHETTPIQPLQADAAGWRDTLVLTYRRGGFLDPPA